MRLTAMFLVFALFGSFAFGEDGTTLSPDTLQDNLALYVCSNAGMKVVKFESETGKWVADFVGAEEPVDIDVGPGDFIFATDEATGAANVRRFDPATGKADADPYGDTSLYLGGPRGLAFGPDGHLYVADMLFGVSQVVEFDDTGTYVRVLPDDPENPVLMTIEDVACDGSGNVYVTQWLYEGTEITGVYKFTGTGWQLFGGTGDLLGPWGLAFGPDGDLYVVDEDTTHFGVFRYNGATGASKGVFGQTGINLDQPRYLTFGPEDGDLYVADAAGNAVKKFSGPLKPDAGTYKDVFGETGAYLSDPIGLVFGPAGGVQPVQPKLAIEKVANGNMLLTLTGTAGKSYELRYSPDATVSDFTTWTFGATITLEGSTTGTWEDVAPTDSRRFYKAKEQ